MQFIQNLSERGVALFRNTEGEHVVVRKFTQEGIQRALNIEQFYECSSFLHKPDIIYSTTDRIAWFQETHETFIEGPELSVMPETRDIVTLSHHINTLSSDILGKVTLSSYIRTAYREKLTSMALNPEQRTLTDEYFLQFCRIAGEEEIGISWVHGDLKGDNIIRNQHGLFFIDWEWVNKKNYLADVQKVIQKILQYDKVRTDIFINEIYKGNNQPLEWKTFVFLEGFYFFLDRVLQFSKGRITAEVFQKEVSGKINGLLSGEVIRIDFRDPSIHLATSQKRELITLYKNKSVISGKMPEGVLFSHEVNNQEMRLNINRWLMLKYRDFITLHGALCKTLEGKVVLLGGPSGSGKTYILESLRQLGIIEQIYDEDLINFRNGQAFALADHSFKGKKHDEYIYEEGDIEYGRIDYILLIDKDVNGYHEIQAVPGVLSKYLVHERYADIGETYYRDYDLDQFSQLKMFVVGNDRTTQDFIPLKNLLCEKV